MTAADIARGLLAGVRLERYIEDDGPTDACWEAVEAGALSGGERGFVAVALTLLGYAPPASARISDHTRGHLRLLRSRLDKDNYRRAAEALLALAVAP